MKIGSDLRGQRWWPEMVYAHQVVVILHVQVFLTLTSKNILRDKDQQCYFNDDKSE